MATITEIKRRILELSPAQFQELGDVLLSKMGYGTVIGYGMQPGTGKTTIGVPDSYFRRNDGRYVLVNYTTQQSTLYSKLKDDIEKCLDLSKSGLGAEDVEEIVCLHTSSNLSAGDDKSLHELCESKGVLLTIIGVDGIANLIHNRYRSLAKDYLSVSIDTKQILGVEDFITQCDANGMTAPLNTVFLYRDKEQEEIINGLDENAVVVVTGKAGVGKTRLVLETIKSYAESRAYQLLCVKNNNLGIYEDLISAVETPGKYLFFIDDANELAELNHFLAYITKDYLGYMVKVILTVRDYAKASVLSVVKEFAFPKTVEVMPFTDDEIKGFVNKNLGIVNEDYVKQIIRVSEGHPRMAYMAGRLAVEKQKLSSIRDASQLYDAYYSKYIDGTLGNDDAICFVAGILAVTGAVLLTELSVFQELLDSYDMTQAVFREKVMQLAGLEVVEIQSEQVATFSDQCLSNYMVYYAFFKKGIVSLADVLEIGYKYFRNGVTKTLNVILGIFESDETKKYCKSEVLKAWDRLRDKHDPHYEDFVMDYHVFRPEEGFLLAKQKIDAIQKEKLRINDVDFNKNVFCQYEGVLDLLTGYKSKEHLEYVMPLLIDYCGKSSSNLISGYNWLESNYGVDTTSHTYKFDPQRVISKYLLDVSCKGDSVAKAIAFQWAKYSLAFSYRSVETGRGNSILFYTIKIQDNDYIRKYRKHCWEILGVLSEDDVWHNKLNMFLDGYSRDLQSESDISLVNYDSEFVEKLLSVLQTNQVSFLKTVRRLLKTELMEGEPLYKKWNNLLKGKAWETFEILEDNAAFFGIEYEAYEQRRRVKIEAFAKSILKEDIAGFIATVNGILSDELLAHDFYGIIQGVEIIAQHIDEDYIETYMHALIEEGPNILISPAVIVTRLNKAGDSNALLNYLKSSDFPRKNEWMFAFFDTLPIEKASKMMLEECLEFFKNDSDRDIVSSPYRSLRFLDKFISLNPNIYPEICELINAKRDYNPFMLEVYCALLFNEHVYSVDELLVLFKGNMKVLQDIYFYVLRHGRLVDYTGAFLETFLNQEELWLERYANVFWEQTDEHIDGAYYRTLAIWKTDDFIKYFDYLFYHVPKELYTWRVVEAFKEILMYKEHSSVVKEHQQQWLSHIIVENAFRDEIVLIFDIVCELGDEMRRYAIKYFLDANADYDAFEKITLLPSHWSGNDSFVPAYQNQIEFLESLYTYVPGTKYLKHKVRIVGLVEELQDMIKKEEVEVIRRKLYM